MLYFTIVIKLRDCYDKVYRDLQKGVFLEDIELMMIMTINGYTFDRRILLKNVLLFFSYDFLFIFVFLIVVAVYVFIYIFFINLSFVL